MLETSLMVIKLAVCCVSAVILLCVMSPKQKHITNTDPPKGNPGGCKTAQMLFRAETSCIEKHISYVYIIAWIML